MFTTCKECGTVFRVSPAELRVAEGQVRCGHCSATFNALATLTAEPPPTTVLPQLQVPPHFVREARIEPELEANVETDPEPDEYFEAETDLEPEPESEPEPGPEPEPEPDISALDSVITSDAVLEFNVPEDNWSEFFVEAVEPQALPPIMAMPAPDESEAEPESVSAGEPETGPDTASIHFVTEDWQDLLNEVPEEADEAPVYRIDADDPDTAPESGSEPVFSAALPIESPDSTRLDEEDEEAVDSSPVPSDNTEPLAEPVLIARRFEWQPDLEPPEAPPRRRWAFGLGALILALALALQLIHYQRDDLAARPALYRPLSRIYTALNLSLLPNWSLHAYEVRGSEAVAGATTPGALDVLARIAIVGPEPVGLPMVRVTLHDRFAKSLGGRVFSPDEYLDGISPPTELLTPGYLIPVRISLRDPGTDAFGYEVDVCVLYRREGLVCQQERDQKAPFTR
jgi:predicted Zn finger-like uncharacterized protein